MSSGQVLHYTYWSQYPRLREDNGANRILHCDKRFRFIHIIANIYFDFSATDDIINGGSDLKFNDFDKLLYENFWLPFVDYLCKNAYNIYKSLKLPARPCKRYLLNCVDFFPIAKLYLSSIESSLRSKIYDEFVNIYGSDVVSRSLVSIDRIYLSGIIQAGLYLCYCYDNKYFEGIIRMIGGQL